MIRVYRAMDNFQPGDVAILDKVKLVAGEVKEVGMCHQELRRLRDREDWDEGLVFLEVKKPILEDAHVRLVIHNDGRVADIGWPDREK